MHTLTWYGVYKELQHSNTDFFFIFLFFFRNQFLHYQSKVSRPVRTPIRPSVVPLSREAGGTPPDVVPAPSPAGSRSKSATARPTTQVSGNFNTSYQWYHNTLLYLGVNMHLKKILFENLYVELRCKIMFSLKNRWIFFWYIEHTIHCYVAKLRSQCFR